MISCVVRRYSYRLPNFRHTQTNEHSYRKTILTNIFRSSRPKMFCKKSILKNFTKFIGKHLCQSLFFNKVAGLRVATVLKKRLWYRCFPVNFAKYLRISFFIEHLWCLLLHLVRMQNRYARTFVFRR